MIINFFFTEWSNLAQPIKKSKKLFELLIHLLYTQLAFVFHPLEDFYIVRNNIDASFLFLLQKDRSQAYWPIL